MMGCGFEIALEVDAILQVGMIGLQDHRIDLLSWTADCWSWDAFLVVGDAF